MKKREVNFLTFGEKRKKTSSSMTYPRKYCVPDLFAFVFLEFRILNGPITLEILDRIIWDFTQVK